MSRLNFAGRLAVCAIMFFAFTPVVMARDGMSGELAIIHPWSRPTAGGAPTAAGYLTIFNNGNLPDRLLGGWTPAADRLEIHQMTMTAGVMSMRPAPRGVVIPARGRLSLAPGGYHLMLIGPKLPFRPGDRIPATLRFERAGDVRIEFKVDGTGSGGSMPGMDMSSDMGNMR